MDTAQTVTRALGLLELLSKHKNLTATQIIEMTEIHRSTTYRLLGTLIQLGYIRKGEDSGYYSLSPKILTLASSVKETRDIKEIAQPFFDELHKKTQETLHLAVLDEDELVYLDKRESTRNLRVVMGSKTGSHAPLYCTGIGKVLLSGMDEIRFREYIKTVQFVKYTGNTISGIQELMNEIDIIREQGYAEDREEHEEGVFCVAAPILGPEGKTLAAFSVSLPMVRNTGVFRQDIIQAVKTASQEISRAVDI
ncbi:MAG: IclR family transcriptional regulator [Spirochaetales bacterium]|nr:IclR family transcriptional regulator [Spirochaetales bacterium]